MKKIIAIVALIAGFVFISCQKDDNSGTQVRDHAEVYAEDLEKIEDYLHKAYIEVQKNADGDVTNVVMDTLDASHTVSIWDQTQYPLQYHTVHLYGIDYKIYYLKLDSKADTDAEGKQPCGADDVGVTYRGKALTRAEKTLPTTHYVYTTTQFDYSPNLSQFNLLNTIRGWTYVIPLFRAGYFEPVSSDGILMPKHYGSGVMFVPSEFAYYNVAGSNFPSYTPLIFTFNLLSVSYSDTDGDKIQSRYEYGYDSDGKYIDSDGDGIADFRDADDDNDGYLTIDEIKKPTPLQPGQGTSLYYPFNPIVDDPSTPADETEPKGIPDASGDGATTTRLRRHLDKNTKLPYTTY